MKLPKELTTITPVSKALALLLFITLPICGFFLGMQYQKILDASISQPDSITSAKIIPTTTLPESSITQKITIEDNYWFEITVPPGYKIELHNDQPTLAIGGRDVATIQNDKGQGVLDIYTYAAGENSPVGTTTIDNVPFFTEYSKTVQCSADLGATNWVPGTKPLFNIHITCEKATNQELATYTNIIESIRFSPALKEVLLGNKPLTTVAPTDEHLNNCDGGLLQASPCPYGLPPYNICGGVKNVQCPSGYYCKYSINSTDAGNCALK